MDSNPETDQLLADLSLVPLTAADIEEFLDYSISNDAEGVSISTRVPSQWIVMINLIRERPGTNLPQIWPTRAAFFRWCVMIGIKQIANYARETHDLTTDPLLSAMTFAEKEAGVIAARAKTLTEATEAFEAIAAGVAINMQLGEYDEAARWIAQWLNGAVAQQSDYWRRLFYKIAATNVTGRPALLSLLADGHLEDAYLAHMIEQQIEREQSVDTVPLTSQS